MINVVHLSGGSLLLTGVTFILKQTQMYYGIKCKNYMSLFVSLVGDLRLSFSASMIGISVENWNRHWWKLRIHLQNSSIKFSLLPTQRLITYSFFMWKCFTSLTALKVFSLLTSFANNLHSFRFFLPNYWKPMYLTNILFKDHFKKRLLCLYGYFAQCSPFVNKWGACKSWLGIRMRNCINSFILLIEITV